MSARCNSKANGLPGKPTHELGYGIRNPGARSEWRAQDRYIPYDILTRPGHYFAGAYPCLGFLTEEQSVIKTIAKGAQVAYDTAVENANPIIQVNTKAWRNALLRANIHDFRWHDLRHTFATWHREAGTPTHELQRLGGWKTQSMVERYAHVAREGLQVAASRIEAYLCDLTGPA